MVAGLALPREYTCFLGLKARTPNQNIVRPCPKPDDGSLFVGFLYPKPAAISFKQAITSFLMDRESFL